MENTKTEGALEVSCVSVSVRTWLPRPSSPMWRLFKSSSLGVDFGRYTVLYDSMNMEYFWNPLYVIHLSTDADLVSKLQS